MRVLQFDHLAVTINVPRDERKTVVYSIPPNKPATGLSYAVYRLDGSLEEFLPSANGLSENSPQLKDVLISAYRNMAEGKLDQILGEGVFSKVWKTFDPEEALETLRDSGKLEELAALPVEQRPILPKNVELQQYTAESLLYGLGYEVNPCASGYFSQKNPPLDWQTKILEGIKFMAEHDYVIVDEGCLGDSSLNGTAEKWGPQAYSQFQENFPNGILGHNLLPYARVHHVENLPGLPREFYEIPDFLERQGYTYKKDLGWVSK